jgi:hypothetical protein
MREFFRRLKIIHRELIKKIFKVNSQVREKLEEKEKNSQDANLDSHH